MQNLRPPRTSSQEGQFEFEQPPASIQSRGRALPTYVIPLILIVLGIVAYLGAMNADFQVTWFDPRYVTDNPMVTDFGPGKLPDIFTDFDAYGIATPLPLLIHGIMQSILGLDAAAFHGLNIVLHGINGALVFLFLQRLLDNRAVALIGALLFLVHPVQVESVAWVTQLRTVLAMTFFLLAFLAHMTSARKKAPGWALPLAAFLFLLSILCKAYAVGGGILFIAYDVLFWRKSFAQAVARGVPYLVIGAIGAVLAFYAQNQAGGTPGMYGDGIADHVQIALRVIWDYATSLVLPINLNHLYLYSAGGNALGAVLGLVVIVLTIVFAVVQPLGRPQSLFAVLWFWVLMLPTANIVPLNLTYRADRYLYFPSVLFFAMIGALVIKLWYLNRQQELRYVLTGIVGALVAGCLFLTVGRVNAWENSGELWSAHLEQEPESENGLLNLGLYQIREEEYADAQDTLTKLIEVDPTVPDSYYALGNLAVTAGQYENALQYYQAFIQLIQPAQPNNTVIVGIGEAFLQLGVQAFDRQEYAAALDNYLRAQEFIPNDPRLHNNIGYTLQQTGNFQEAVLAYNQALELNPNYGRAWANLGDTATALENFPLASSAYARALELNVMMDALSFSNYCIALAEQRIEPEIALQACQQSVQLAPDTPIFLARTGHMLVMFEQPNEAIVVAQQALALDPNMTLAYRVLGDAYLKLGDAAQAEAAYRTALELDPNNLKAQAGLATVTGQPLPTAAPPAETAPTTEAPAVEPTPTEAVPTPEPTPTTSPYEGQ
jgi:protein O-mannosyl-transferase